MEQEIFTEEIINKDIDYDAFMRDMYREKMNNIMSLIGEML